MNINLVGLRDAGISIGDELAAFDGKLCVGTLKIMENHLINGSASLIASFSTDDQIKNGFTEGDPIQIVVWNKLTNTETKMAVSALNGTLNYLKNASILAKVNSVTSSVNRIDDIVQVDVFPNPSQGMFTVRFSAIPDSGSMIDVLDLSGRKVFSRLITGLSEEFNLAGRARGMYLVKSILGSNEIMHKLVLN